MERGEEDSRIEVIQRRFDGKAVPLRPIRPVQTPRSCRGEQARSAPGYSAPAAALFTLRVSFSLMRADLPERSRR